MSAAAAIVWLMVAAASGSSAAPTVIYTFPTEKQCEAAASDLSARSFARRTQKGRRFAGLDAVCLPVPSNDLAAAQKGGA